jgi:branched-chain amino acid transport system ATP-binding protein
MTATGLLVEGLEVRYGAAVAVRDLSLTAPPGTLTVLIGRNGAGKSTSLQAIGGFVRRSAGSVTLDGKPLDNGVARKSVRRGVVYVPETRRLFPNLTVEDNLRVGKGSTDGSRGRYTPESCRARFEIIDRLWGRDAGTLSGGEQQFVTVCRGFCLQPRVLLLDEMSQGVAPKAAGPLVEMVAEFIAEGGTAIVAEQNLRLATELASQADGQVHVMESGEVLVRGHWREVLRSEVLESAVGLRAMTGATTAPGA